MQQGASELDGSFRPANQSNTISAAESPANHPKGLNINHLLQRQESQADTKTELRIKLELMQKLQTELLQMIQGQEEKDGMHSNSSKGENKSRLYDFTSRLDTSMPLFFFLLLKSDIL